MTTLVVVCRTCSSTFEALKILPRDHLVVCPVCRNVVGKYDDLWNAAMVEQSNSEQIEASPGGTEAHSSRFKP